MEDPEIQWTGERVVPKLMMRDVRTYQEHLARYTWALGYLVGNGAVLDAACGTGYGTELISHVTVLRPIGMDISQEAISYAKSHYLGAAFMHRDLSNVISLAEQYDAIVSFETIEHLEDPGQFLGHAFQSLKPGGLFIFSIPLNAPSQFHKQVFEDETAVRTFIRKFFPHNIAWFWQTGMDIKPAFFGQPGQFILGVAKK